MIGGTVGDTTRYLGRWPFKWTLQSARTTKSLRRGRFTSSKPANAPSPIACKINSCLISTAPDWLGRVYPGTIECSGADRNNNPATGFNSLVNRNKAGAADRTNKPVGEKHRCGLRKKARKYQALVEQCKDNKWRTACYPIEVGCRGFAGRSVCRILTRLFTIWEKRQRPSERFQNMPKKRRDCYGLKDQNHGVEQTNGCGGIW